LATSPRNPNFFVDDPGKLYGQRRRATQAKGLETLDSKTKVEGPSKSPRESPPPSQDARRPFKIKRRMEKMEIKKEAQHLKAAKARSTCEVFIVMKMLETQVGQLAGQPMGDKGEYPRQPQGPEMAKATQTHSEA
jgi:hypothetical protein